MMKNHASFCVYLVLLASTWGRVLSQDENPNLIVVMTDEQNFRTVGAYRNLMSDDQAFPWGEGVSVDTPNIDRLAREGVLFRNFYAVTPLCTPSRASFMTGMYPKFTGAWKNHGKLRKRLKTFANELRALKAYQTAFMGKWHLNGKTKSASDFGNEKRRFGFLNIDYQFNRGHWKWFDRTKDGVEAYEWKDGHLFTGNPDGGRSNYATDFLFDRGMEFIDEKVKNGKNFALMLSIPDPHAPNDVRAPYDRAFRKLKFEVPETAKKAMHRDPALPGWADVNNFSPENADDQIQAIADDPTRQSGFSQVFGMIQLLDHKMGELLDFLDEKNLFKNTIVVFTSDHGDMMGEHGRLNKGVPYAGSAQVPMLIRWPGNIRRGKIIETAYSSVDFVPTILGLMGVNSRIESHGIDGSAEIRKRQEVSRDEDQIRFLTDSKKRTWAAAVTARYKLVLSKDTPWLFDLERDPDELINFYGDPEYEEIGAKLKTALLGAMDKYKFVLKQRSYLPDAPVCWDSRDEIEGWDNMLCTDLNSVEFKPACSWDFVKDPCPRVCDECCEDSQGQVWLYGAMRTCDEMDEDIRFCTQESAQLFCPDSCGLCNS